MKAVAMDLCFAYTSAAMMNVPEVAIVYDRFHHLIKLFNDVLSNLRREIQRQAQTHQGKELVKGVRWLLLRRPGDLDETKNE